MSVVRRFLVTRMAMTEPGEGAKYTYHDMEPLSSLDGFRPGKVPRARCMVVLTATGSPTPCPCTAWCACLREIIYI